MEKLRYAGSTFVPELSEAHFQQNGYPMFQKKKTAQINHFSQSKALKSLRIVAMLMQDFSLRTTSGIIF
jgi:hypothetical protein